MSTKISKTNELITDQDMGNSRLEKAEAIIDLIKEATDDIVNIRLNHTGLAGDLMVMLRYERFTRRMMAIRYAMSADSPSGQKKGSPPAPSSEEPNGGTNGNKLAGRNVVIQATLSPCGEPGEPPESSCTE